MTAVEQALWDKGYRIQKVGGREEWYKAGPVETINCGTCNSEITKLKSVPQKYCSSHCSGIASGKKSTARKTLFPDRICPTCGKPYHVTSKSIKQQHCSMSCAQSDPVVARKKLESARSNPLAQKSSYASCKRGWFKIGGKTVFFRSSWEVYYAKYLEVLKRSSGILDWEHEPKTFWFESIQRGTRSYLPDFKVTYPDGRHEWHEVKGWMDSRSKAQLSRMRIYYPDEKVVVIDKDRIRPIKAMFGKIVIALGTTGQTAGSSPSVAGSPGSNAPAPHRSG